jgi:hypothetical protein
MSPRAFPTIALLPAFAVLALLALGGCGGSDFTGDVKVPHGYNVYRGNGVSFVHPASWSPTTRTLARGVTEIRFADPGGKGPAAAAVSLTIEPGVGARFEAQLDSERAVLESVGGAEVSQDAVDVPGADKAFRSTVEVPDRGSGPSASQAVDVLLPDGRHLALAAGAPDSRRDAIDADAVITSLRLERP